MNDNTIVKIVAIISLTALGITALLKGIDHVILASIASIIGGVAGYEIGKKQKVNNISNS